MYKAGDSVKIGLVKYTVVYAIDVPDSMEKLKQENVVQTLAIQDDKGTFYSCKVYGKGGFSIPKKMLSNPLDQNEV